uniref:Uncharacterized protein n=1 Tax=viral metagenome TaxID=1070528 RepID=A0A6H1Z9K1_9ZZZZ
MKIRYKVVDGKKIYCCFECKYCGNPDDGVHPYCKKAKRAQAHDDLKCPPDWCPFSKEKKARKR